MISLETGTVIAGGYRLERLLARGGMGSVWVARHLRLDVDVAIKFMTTEYAASSEARARFEREAKASAQLKSPNVVQVHDYGVEGETPYIVMELLEGEDLNARLERVGRLSLQATYTIIDQVCKALRRSHEVGLVHRDLKPANIFLTTHLGEEIVKVLDFGIAKAISVSGPVQAGKATRTGTLIGSPHYMSPEQIRRSKQVDHRSDLWSLGVITFQCLTGRLPFSGEEFAEVLVEVCSDPIPPPSSFAPDLPSDVDRFIERALTRDIDQRFQSARELAEALQAIAAPGTVRGSAAELAARGSAQEIAAAPPNARSPHASGGFTPVPVTFAMGESSAPSHAASPGHVAVGVTPTPRLLQPSSSTLAPSGGTLATPPGRGRSIGLLVGAASLVLALGLTVFFVARRAPSTVPSAAAAPTTLAVGSATPPLDPSASREKMGAAIATAAEPAMTAPSAPASAADLPTPAATAASAPSAGPRKRPGVTKKRSADPLDSR
jgi:eukaryotic-like serine/threonine-protein kinase